MSKQSVSVLEKTPVVVESPLNEVTGAGTPPAFRTVKAVTRPVLKFGVGPEFVMIESAMRQGEHMPGSKITALPILMDVVNLKTGEAMLIVVPTVLRQELDKAYPEGTYAGKSFQLRKIRTEDRDYSLWAIAEIEVL